MFKKSALFALSQIGLIKYEGSVARLVVGIYGDKYETPKDLRFASVSNCTNRPMAIPKKPEINPKKTYMNL